MMNWQQQIPLVYYRHIGAVVAMFHVSGWKAEGDLSGWGDWVTITTLAFFA
jgi:hypothetical protein